jgi:hypothetical protein
VAWARDCGKIWRKQLHTSNFVKMGQGQDPRRVAIFIIIFVQILHAPRFTDDKHTRKNRRIQEELAFTLTTNATKPSPSKIVQLQATRKKINWKI